MAYLQYLMRFYNKKTQGRKKLIDYKIRRIWDADTKNIQAFIYIAMAFTDGKKMASSPANVGAQTVEIAKRNPQQMWIFRYQWLLLVSVVMVVEDTKIILHRNEIRTTLGKAHSLINPKLL